MSAARGGGAERIDWAAVRRRLEEVSGAITASGRRSEAEGRALLASRARELARPVAEATDGTALELITFERGRQRYGLESRYIQEIFAPGPLAVLPGVPPPVVGAVAWRGEILVLLEVGAGATEIPPEAVVLAIGAERPEFGIIGDAAGELTRVSPGAIARPAEGLAADRAALRGVTAAGMLVLDGPELIRIHTQRSGT